MKRTIVPLIALPVVVVATLSACGGGGGPAPSALEACVTGHTWTLDVNDAASQLQTRFDTLGLPLTSVTGTGSETMKWDADGKTVIETNLAWNFTIQEDATNTLVITQTNRGPATGIFTIDGTKAIPSGWDSTGYTSVNSTSVNGVPGGESSIPVPPTELAGVTLELTCSPTDLTTKASDGAVNWHWTR
jgi:hypothetical protein